MTELASRDLRVQRRRQEELDALAAQGRLGGNLGEPCLVGITTSDGTYPVVARSYFKVALNALGGTLGEGKPVTLTDLGLTDYAANLGGSVPPVGTPVRLDKVSGGRLVFRYDG